MTRHATIPSIQHESRIAVRGVRWTISPDALRMYAPAMLNGHAAQVSDAQLIIELDQLRPRATLTLCYGATTGTEHALPLPDDAALSVSLDAAAGLEHIEIPGILSMTLRRGEGAGAPKLVYAHSPLLAAIGLPGGVYDVPELLPV